MAIGGFHCHSGPDTSNVLAQSSLLSFHMWLNLSLPSIALVALPPLPGQTLGGHLQPPCLIWFHPSMGWWLRETSLLIAEVCLPGHMWSASASQLCLPAPTDLYLLMDFAVSGLAAPCMMLIGSFLSKGRPWTSSVFPAAPEVRDATCVRGYGYGLEESEDVSEAIGHAKAAAMPSAWLHLTDMVEFFWERTGLTSSIPMEEQKRSGLSVNALQQHWLAPDSGFVPFRPHSCHFFFCFHT